MERWAANTLRGIGIVLTSLFLVCASLVLLLASFCAWNGGLEGYPHHDQAIGYLIGLAFLLALGIFVISRLARDFMRATTPPVVATPAVQYPMLMPIHLSPGSRNAIHYVMAAIVVAITIGVAVRTISVQRNWTMYRSHSGWLVSALIAAILDWLPELILLFRLRQKPDRTTFTFSLAVPIANLLRTAVFLPQAFPALRYMSRQGSLTPIILPMAGGAASQLAIAFLAWRANRKLEYRQEVASVVVACVVTCTYYMIVSFASTKLASLAQVLLYLDRAWFALFALLAIVAIIGLVKLVRKLNA